MGYKVEGHDDVVRLFQDEIPQKLPELKRKTLQAFADRFLFLLNQFAPRRTGEYAGSWEILEFTENRITIGIKPGRTHSGSGIDMNQLFVILEFGVNKPVTIVPKTAKVLRFVFHDDTVFTKRVVIPPRPPRPHMRTAFDDVVREIPDIVNQVLDEVMPGMRKK